MTTGFPTTEMQTMASSIDDQLTVWDRRTGEYRAEHEAAGEKAVRSMGDLIGLIGELRDEVDEDVREFAKWRTSAAARPPA